MTDRLALATRAIRAQRKSQCPQCNGVIMPGTSIAKLSDPTTWIHTACVPVVAAANHQHEHRS